MEENFFGRRVIKNLFEKKEKNKKEKNKKKKKGWQKRLYMPKRAYFVYLSKRSLSLLH